MMNETNLVVLQRAFDIFDARYDDADVTSKRLIIIRRKKWGEV